MEKLKELIFKFYEKLLFTCHKGDPGEFDDECQSDYIRLKLDDEKYLVITADSE